MIRGGGKPLQTALQTLLEDPVFAVSHDGVQCRAVSTVMFFRKHRPQQGFMYGGMKGQQRWFRSTVCCLVLVSNQ